MLWFFFFFWWLGVEVVVGGGGCSCGCGLSVMSLKSPGHGGFESKYQREGEGSRPGLRKMERQWERVTEGE